MKLSKILSEARARPGTRKGVTHYHAEFGGDGTDIEWSKWDAQSVRSYEGAIRDAQDEFKVVGLGFIHSV